MYFPLFFKKKIIYFFEKKLFYCFYFINNNCNYHKNVYKFRLHYYDLIYVYFERFFILLPFVNNIKKLENVIKIIKMK